MLVNNRDPEGYADLASQGPIEPALGHAFLTLVEPHNGHNAAYTRWYEDDHFHAAGMSFPWWFAGKRQSQPGPCVSSGTAVAQLRTSTAAGPSLPTGSLAGDSASRRFGLTRQEWPRR